MTQYLLERRLGRVVLLAATLGASACQPFGHMETILPSAPTGACFPDSGPEAGPATSALAPDIVEIPPEPVWLDSVGPRYPGELQATRTPGRVVAFFVVDTLGALERPCVRIVESTHVGLSRSVCEWLAGARFRPGRHGGQLVRAWVRQEFLFRMAPNARGPGRPLPES
jgi:hypothetical protein